MARRGSSSRTRRGGGMGSVTLTWDRTLSTNIREGQQLFMLSLAAELEGVAQDMQAFAKSHHPWTNRTGDAERTFTVRVVNSTTIVAQHGVPYGKWLEWKHGGRWGVIPMTLDYGRGRLREAYAKAWTTAWRFQ